jgi:hypothetical protein
LNFTLIDPASVAGASAALNIQEDCASGRTASRAITSAAFSPIM